MKSIFLILAVLVLHLPAVTASDFSSPAAKQSYELSGDMSVQPDVAALAAGFVQGGETYQTVRSTGCSGGCSEGCSGGCSYGCSYGCR